MKRVLLLILFLTAYLYPQWNTVVSTTINEPNLYKLENFANKDGIHLVTQRYSSTNSIMYYRLNSSGVVQATTVIETQGYAEFPSIAGANDALYISYRKGNNIITKKYNYSTSAWDQLQTITFNSQDNFRGIDNVYDSRGLHLVFASGPYDHQDMKTKYYRYPIGWYNYTDYKDVSEQTYEAEYPTVTVSANKVHVGFNDYGSAKTRDKNLITNTWESIQPVYDYGFQNVHSGGDKLFSFSWVYQGLPLSLYVKERNVNSTSWSNAFMLNYSVYGPMDYKRVISAANTSDNKTHIIYPTSNLIHRYYDVSTGWSSEEVISNNFERFFSLSSTSNDLFSVFYSSGSSTIKFRQYDAAPLAPQNLSVTKSANNHPLLSWSRNNEADLDHYNIYKYAYSEQGWYLLGTTSNNSFEDVNETYLTGGAVANEHWVYYKITAVDKDPNPYESAYSNQVGARVKGSALEKLSNLAPNEYSLDQNFPNPFNPSTKIAYSIKEEGLVTLKVYDVLGKEVATLINENKPEGNYEVDFNASELPSGMYIYKLQSGGFSDVKKMLLTK